MLMSRYVSVARWVLVGGLLAFAVSVATAEIRSAPPDAPKKDEPKKDAPKKDEPRKVFPDDFPFPQLPDVPFPPNFDPQEFQKFQEDLKKAHDEFRKHIAELQKVNPGLFPNAAFQFPPEFIGLERKPRDNRLGAV